MKIITAGDANFKEMIPSCVAMNKKCGYETIVYDLGGLGFGIPFDVSEDVKMIEMSTNVLYTGKTMQKGSFKPKIILDAMLRFPEEKELLWLDGDAYCIGKNIHNYFTKCDVGVTMRRKGEHAGSVHPMWDQYLNSGVVYFENNPRTQMFVKQWIELVPTTWALSDQEALNIMVDAPNLKVHDLPYLVNRIVVRSFQTDIMNFYYFPEVPKFDTQILHFKGVKEDTMKYFKQYLTV